MSRRREEPELMSSIKNQQETDKLKVLQLAIEDGFKSGDAGELDMQEIKQIARQREELRQELIAGEESGESGKSHADIIAEARAEIKPIG